MPLLHILYSLWDIDWSKMKNWLISLSLVCIREIFSLDFNITSGHVFKLDVEVVSTSAKKTNNLLKSANHSFVNQVFLLRYHLPRASFNSFDMASRCGQLMQIMHLITIISLSLPQNRRTKRKILVDEFHRNWKRSEISNPCSCLVDG